MRTTEAIPATADGHPLTRLDADDLSMICEFVLASGSIKDLAAAYSVSYPTMRQRLDQLIARLRGALQDRPPDPLNDYLADLIAKGRLAPAAARRIRELHDSTIEALTGPPSLTTPR